PCGAAVNLDIIPGMAAHGWPLKTVGDALLLRNHLIGLLERAEVETDAILKNRLLSVVVVGGGFSGVEVTGEIADLLRASARFYRTIRRSDIQVALLEARDRILPDLPPSLSAFARKKMAQNGITVRADGPARRAPGQAARRQPDAGARRPADAALFVQAGRHARLHRRPQGGRPDLRREDFRLCGVVHLARHLPLEDADLGPQDSDRLRLAVATLLPARHRAAQPRADAALRPRPFRAGSVRLPQRRAGRQVLRDRTRQRRRVLGRSGGAGGDAQARRPFR